jgi:hypothetical protein
VEIPKYLIDPKISKYHIPMKVLFFEPYTRWTHHLGTCLEIIQNHLDQGDEVTFFGCDASLPACDPNRSHKLDSCLLCIGRRRKGLNLLTGKIKYENFVRLGRDDRRKISYLKTDFKDMEELKRYRIGNFDIGYAAASSFLHRTEDADRNMPEFDKKRQLILRLMKSAYKVYLSFINHLNAESFDRVYIFNGRFAPLRGVLRICQEKGVECFLHERGANIHKYTLYKNCLPHEIEKIEKLIWDTWENSDDQDKEQIASDFYRAQAAGKELSWYSYVKGQKPNLLPGQWDPGKKNIVIFNSSEFEFGAIGDEWRNPLYASQVDGIEKIVNSMAQHGEKFHIYLRIHPNLSGARDKSITDIFKITLGNFTIISAESEISTYTLVRAANKIVTFGSTVGIEAAFWGKPSILAGMSFYRNLGSVYTPSSHEELIEMLLSDLPPRNKDGALMYGYYRNTFGIKFKYFKAEGIFDGTFKDANLNPTFSGFVRIMLMIGNTRVGRPLSSILGRIHADWLL